MESLVYAIALWALLEIPTDFGPAELMIFTAPAPSERLLNPPQNDELTRELLEFARHRPYWQEVPHWWSEMNNTTAEVAQRLQECEEWNRTLPPLEDTYRFPPEKDLRETVYYADRYYEKLIEDSRFLLKEEQDCVAEIYKQYKIYRVSYFEIINARNETSPYIYRRQCLQSIKDTIGDKLYNKGILPRLVP